MVDTNGNSNCIPHARIHQFYFRDKSSSPYHWFSKKKKKLTINGMWTRYLGGDGIVTQGKSDPRPATLKLVGKGVNSIETCFILGPEYWLSLGQALAPNSGSEGPQWIFIYCFFFSPQIKSFHFVSWLLVISSYLKLYNIQFIGINRFLKQLMHRDETVSQQYNIRRESSILTRPWARYKTMGP